VIGPVIDDVMTTRPFFFAFIAGRTAETDRNVPLRLVAIT
jgi:hypothetical protein